MTDDLIEAMARAMYAGHIITRSGAPSVSWDEFREDSRWVPNYTGAARAALAAIEAAGRRTAPESPPAFLVWLADEGFATLAYMKSWEADGEKGRDLYLPAMDAWADEHIATHWQPLPPPPGEQPPAEAVAAAYRRGQEEMRERALAAARLGRKGPWISHAELCIHALPIKDAP